MSVILVLWLLGISMAVGVLIAASHWQRFERIGAEISAGLLLATLPFVFMAFHNIGLLILAAAAHIWLLVLPARLVMGRLERLFLLDSTWLSAVYGLLILIALTLLELWQPAYLSELVLTLLLTASLGASVFFFGQLWWNTRRFRLKVSNEMAASTQLPTISVCIPARNEDHALAECLASVLASDYPKLEVIVLDDCSQDSTSSIVRSFAHDGVRFVQGEAPANGWLGKNQAMHVLAGQASGEYIIFMSVDTHVAPHSITQLMQYMLTNKLGMVSVLPQNRLGVGLATLGGPLEYFWRQVLPISDSRMPVSSKFWCIATNSLTNMGGFASSRRRIVPEETFAVRLHVRDAYRFLISNKTFGVTTAKRWSSQIETSIRIAYPRLQRQPIALYVVCIAIFGLFIVPPAIILVSLLFGYAGFIFWLAVAATVLPIGNYALALRRVQPKGWWGASLLWPVVSMQEIGILITSMLLYEFGEVMWKGRNVCYPVFVPQKPSARPLRNSQNALVE